MSFRFRVFGLVLLIAVTAVGLTAWLSVRLAAAQFAEAQQTATRNEAALAARREQDADPIYMPHNVG